MEKSNEGERLRMRRMDVGIRMRKERKVGKDNERKEPNESR